MKLNLLTNNQIKGYNAYPLKPTERAAKQTAKEVIRQGGAKSRGVKIPQVQKGVTENPIPSSSSTPKASATYISPKVGASPIPKSSKLTSDEARRKPKGSREQLPGPKEVVPQPDLEGSTIAKRLRMRRGVERRTVNYEENESEKYDSESEDTDDTAVESDTPIPRRCYSMLPSLDIPPTTHKYQELSKTPSSPSAKGGDPEGSPIQKDQSMVFNPDRVVIDVSPPRILMKRIVRMKQEK